MLVSGRIVDDMGFILHPFQKKIVKNCVHLSPIVGVKMNKVEWLIHLCPGNPLVSISWSWFSVKGGIR